MRRGSVPFFFLSFHLFFNLWHLDMYFTSKGNAEDAQALFAGLPGFVGLGVIELYGVESVRSVATVYMLNYGSA